MSNFLTLNDRLYSNDGFWFLIENDVATVGLSEWLSDRWGAINGIMLSDWETERGKPFLELQDNSNKTEEFKIVVAGAIEKNLEIESDIYNIYDQPYEVWTHKITMTDPNDRNLLLTAEQFAASKGYTPRLSY